LSFLDELDRKAWENPITTIVIVATQTKMTSWISSTIFDLVKRRTVAGFLETHSVSHTGSI